MANRGQFKRGQSGNPNGRPSATPRTFVETFDEVSSHIDWSRPVLVEVQEWTSHQSSVKKRKRPPRFDRDRYRAERADQEHCEICGCKFSPGKHQTGKCVDHDHHTGEIRGLICQGCNKALGFIKDNPATAEKMAAYLRREKPDKP